MLQLHNTHGDNAAMQHLHASSVEILGKAHIGCAVCGKTARTLALDAISASYSGKPKRTCHAHKQE
ncbi:MAG: hypothetical protein AAFN94_10290 [Pseudomonadota bacterium]